MTAPEEELEDEAVGRQYTTKASVSAYSDLTALSPALFLFRSLPMPAAQGDGPEKFKELAPPRENSAGGAARCRCCCCRNYYQILTEEVILGYRGKGSTVVLRHK